MNAPINRSQSLLTTNHRIPTLAPPRSERARIEALLNDVWSRDILPFPGMASRSKSEQLVRNSASSMMRKLSVASIASSFSRRPGSLTSLHKTSAGAETGDGDDESGQGLGNSSVEDTILEKTPCDTDSNGSGKIQMPAVKTRRRLRKAVVQMDQGQPRNPGRNANFRTQGLCSQDDVPRRLVWAQDERKGGSLSPVSGSAANSLQLNRPQSKPSPAPLEKENNQPEKAGPEGDQEGRDKRMRTNKAGLKRDMVFSGIRGIFR